MASCQGRLRTASETRRCGAREPCLPLPAPCLQRADRGCSGFSWHLQHRGGMLDPRPSPTAPWGLAEGFLGVPGGLFPRRRASPGMEGGWRQEHPGLSVRALHVPWGRGDGGDGHPTATVGANMPGWGFIPRGAPVLGDVSPWSHAAASPRPWGSRRAAMLQPHPNPLFNIRLCGTNLLFNLFSSN